MRPRVPFPPPDRSRSPREWFSTISGCPPSGVRVPEVILLVSFLAPTFFYVIPFRIRKKGHHGLLVKSGSDLYAPWYQQLTSIAAAPIYYPCRLLIVQRPPGGARVPTNRRAPTCHRTSHHVLISLH